MKDEFLDSSNQVFEKLKNYALSVYPEIYTSLKNYFDDFLFTYKCDNFALDFYNNLAKVIEELTINDIESIFDRFYFVEIAGSDEEEIVEKL